MTLSIEDGANDVAMTQEANIGGGLFGHEGSQAAMSADLCVWAVQVLDEAVDCAWEMVVPTDCGHAW